MAPDYAVAKRSRRSQTIYAVSYTHLDEVAYQFAELGKVDAGGGGTIAYIMANYGMEVIDSGVAVLCMHAPWELSLIHIFYGSGC